MKMKSMLTWIGFVWAIAQVANAQSVGSTSIRDGWVTVPPPEFHGAINNPLKGFREYKKNGCGLLKRQYIKWNDIEVCLDDSVERIIAHTKKIPETTGKRFEDLNVKLVPCVYLDWNGSSGKQHWPANLHTIEFEIKTKFQDETTLLAPIAGIRGQKRRRYVWQLHHDVGRGNRERPRRVGQERTGRGHARYFHFGQRSHLV